MFGKSPTETECILLNAAVNFDIFPKVDITVLMIEFVQTWPLFNNNQDETCIVVIHCLYFYSPILGVYTPWEYGVGVPDGAPW